MRFNMMKDSTDPCRPESRVEPTIDPQAIHWLAGDPAGTVLRQNGALSQNRAGSHGRLSYTYPARRDEGRVCRMLPHDTPPSGHRPQLVSCQIDPKRRTVYLKGVLSIQVLGYASSPPLPLQTPRVVPTPSSTPDSMPLMKKVAVKADISTETSSNKHVADLDATGAWRLVSLDVTPARAINKVTGNGKEPIATSAVAQWTYELGSAEGNPVGPFFDTATLNAAPTHLSDSGQGVLRHGDEASGTADPANKIKVTVESNSINSN